MSISYFEFDGQEYYPGTKVRMKDRVMGGTFIATFKERICHHNQEDELRFYGTFSFRDKVSHLQSSILDVVEVPNPEELTYNTSRRRPPNWQVEMGITWYIIIMLVCALFKDRWIGWIFITSYFVLWLNGFMNGGKK